MAEPPVGLLIATARTQAGDPYVFGAEAKFTDPDPDAFDCSELIEWVCHRHGVTSCPDGSVNQFAWCKRWRTLVELPQGIATAGALLFRLDTNPRHVALSLGDGTTFEARGRRFGVNQFPATGRHWTHAALIPGVDYSPPRPPQLRKAAAMILHIKGSPYHFFVRGVDPAGVLVLVALTEAEAWETAAAGAHVLSVSAPTFDKIRKGERWDA